MDLKYIPLERLSLQRPVDRLEYMSNLCRDKKVLDLGCYDETAIKIKRHSKYWLHNLISEKAESVIGIDSSKQIIGEIKTGKHSKIIKLDLFDIDEKFVKTYPVEVIIAGELIEHIENVQLFLGKMKEFYPGSKLVLSIPNATFLANVLLSLFNRESNHKDHIHMFSYKTLNTVCLKAGFKKFSIKPCKAHYTEMYLNAKGFKKVVVKTLGKIANFFEYFFPLLSAGYVVEIEL